MSDATPEEWRPIPGYEALYEVSSIGRVRSLPRATTSGKIRKLRLNRHGRYDINLSADNRTRTFNVHVLVALAFIGPRPDGYDVRHLNGDRTDNRLANLGYSTHSENLRDRIAHGTDPNAAKTHCPQGHEYTPENTKTIPSRRGRFCRECQNAFNRERYRRLKRI